MKRRIGISFALTVLVAGTLAGCADNGQNAQIGTPQAVEVTTQATEITDKEGEIKNGNNNDKSTDGVNETVQEDVDMPTAAEAPTWARVSETKAKKIALKEAGVKASKVENLFVTIDFDDGKQVYDVEFNVGKKEYEYTIDATSGKILDKDADIDD